MPRAIGLYKWREAIMSKLGPPKLMRLVLMAISMYMDTKTTLAFPSQALIAEGAGVSERTVRRLLEGAVADGWVQRRSVRTRKGRGWRRHEYTASIPDGVYESMMERSGQVEPIGLQQPVNVAASQLRGEHEGPSAPERAVTGARVPVNGDIDNRSELGRITPHLNSSMNSSFNSSEGMSVCREKFSSSGERGGTHEIKGRAEILDLLLRKRYTPEEAEKLLKIRGITHDDVMRVKAEVDAAHESADQGSRGGV